MELALAGGAPVRSRPFPRWPDYDGEEERLLLEVLRSEKWGGYNGKVEEFERAFASLHDVPCAVSCANGTVALEVALKALGIDAGDEVIVPAITFVATATSVLLCRAAPVFVDIDPATLGLSPAAVETAITPRTRAIIAVHFGGHPADLDALVEIAQRHNLALIEDAAHAHGAAWRAKPVGGFGAAATFSFQAFKLMTAGEGGIVVTGSPESAEKLWAYCNHGRRQGEGWYEHYTLGSNYRMTGFQAALLLAQLSKLPEQTQVRTANVNYLRGELKDVHGLKLVADDPRVTAHPHYLVTLRYDPDPFDGLPRDLVIRALQAEGIPAQRPYPFPLYRNPLFRRANLPPFRSTDWKAPQEYESLFLPESERLCQDGIWLGHSVFLGTHQDVDDVLDACEKVQRHAAKLSQANLPDLATRAKE